MTIRCSIGTFLKELVIASFSIHKNFIELQILQYHKVPFNESFGLFNLAIGQHDFGRQSGILIKFLWWERHWYKKGVNKNA